VQEGLTNARKHAPGSAVRVQLDGEPGTELRIRISNPGPAPAARPDVPGAGMGLVGIGERVALAGGHVRYGPEGDDFLLEARLPWRG
jgi:signal transduction histidine kinase